MAALKAGCLAAAPAALLACCLAWGAPPASAQVVRCTDPATGQVTYTDSVCRRGDEVREVEARKSAQDIAQEREQAAQALARRHERQLQEEQLRAQTPPPAPDVPPDPARSPQCLRARQQLEQALAAAGQGMYDERSRLEAAQRQADLACLTPSDLARLRASRPYAGEVPPPVVVVPPRHVRPPPAPTPPRREITHCNVFRCYDRQGNIYPR